MPSTIPNEPKSIYAWLCCPACDSRDIIRGPRFDDGSVELRCDDCGLTTRAGL